MAKTTGATVTGVGKNSIATAPEVAAAGDRLRRYFLASALLPSLVGLLVAAIVHARAAFWLAGCAAVGVVVGLATVGLAMRRVVVPLHGIADGLSRAASNADRLKSTFVANMSHEIRTPLNSVLALSQLLRDSVAGPLTVDQRKYLEIITRNGQTLLRLIDDILDLSRIESGHIELDTDDVDLAPQVTAIVEAVEPLAMAKGLHLTVRLPENLPAASCDVDRVRQILTNLIGNAIKFTETGTVRVTAGFDAAMVDINVTDTGVGIPEDQLERIFDEFVQVDQTLARRQGGTGLGLAIASRLARLMGGEISVSSLAGSGSRFTLTLPRAAQDPEKKNVSRLSMSGGELVEQIAGEAYAADPRRAPITVLIVEDNEDNLFTLREILAPFAFETVAATTGRQAIEYCRRQLPDLIIMDVQMPGMSGLQATGAIRALPSGAEVPILALTAQAMKGDRERILSAGCDDYLAKPVPPRELRATVSRLLASRRPHGQGQVDDAPGAAARGPAKGEPHGAHPPRR